MNAQQIVSALTEDMAGPCDKKQATLQYRPVSLGGEWRWYWVLLPSDRSKAYATGDSGSRAEASTAARLTARKMGITIKNIDVLMAKRSQALG